MNVFLSTHGWKPEYRGRGSLFCWSMGEVVTLRSRNDPNKTAQVRIDSEMLKHPDAPGNGLVYEVVFLDGSGRHAAAADQIEP